MRVYRRIGGTGVSMSPATFGAWGVMRLIVIMCFAVVVAAAVVAAVLVILLWGGIAGTYDYRHSGKAQPWSVYARARGRAAKIMAARTAMWFGIGR